jgi:hypothetical protein
MLIRDTLSRLQTDQYEENTILQCNVPPIKEKNNQISSWNYTQFLRLFYTVVV